jgi:hypothetical protein
MNDGGFEGVVVGKVLNLLDNLLGREDHAVKVEDQSAKRHPKPPPRAQRLSLKASRTPSPISTALAHQF